nr:RNA-dependent RNA polymerase [Narnavirus sp.]
MSNQVSNPFFGAERPSESALWSSSPPLRFGLEAYRRYCRENPASILHGWNEVHRQERMKRIDKFFPFVLKTDVIVKLSLADYGTIKRLINIIEGFKDNFMFSQPERFLTLIKSSQYIQFMRWVISTETHKPGFAIDQWKEFINLVRWRALQSQTDEPPIPVNFPGVDRRSSAGKIRVSPFWQRLCPLLGEIWDGLKTKDQGTRFMHFCSSRNLPAAPQWKREKAELEHYKVLTTPGPDLEARNRWLYYAALDYGRSLIKPNDRMTERQFAHLSLTNSASILSPVRDGGRGTEIAARYREWATKPATETIDELTWFGMRYWKVKDIPVWRTMCRPHMAPDGIPGDSGLLENVSLEKGEFVYSDPIVALDAYTGYQILQWSIEYAIETQRLKGTPYLDYARGLKVKEPAHIRVGVIGEPGNKARVITVGEAWLTVFLQPLSHVLSEFLKRDPDVRSSFTRGWQGFEYCKRWTSPKFGTPLPEERFILSSDLKTATDYCPFGYSRSLLEGFIDGLGIKTCYTKAWIEVLTSPRVYRGIIPEIPTKRGILMGDPGTKVVLTLFNKAAEMEAMRRFNLHLHRVSLTMITYGPEWDKKPHFRLFSCSGDDHVAIGPVKYLREITKAHINNGMKVSTSTNFISSIGGIYCEELVFIKDQQIWDTWGLKCPFKTVHYDRHPHVDSIKMRLFSLCVKETEGRNDTNPAIGMAPTLRSMLEWMDECKWTEIKALASIRFRQRVRGLIPSNLFLCSLPRALGGVEAPYYDLTYEDLKEAFSKLSRELRRMFCWIFRYKEPDTLYLRILSQVSSMSSIRGVDPDSIEESIRAVLASELCCAKEMDDFYFEIEDDEVQDRWPDMTKRQKLEYIENHFGYLSCGNSINTINRPYVFRDILYPEESVKHGIDPSKRKGFTRLSWTERYSRVLKAFEKIQTSRKDESKEFNSWDERPEESDVYDTLYNKGIIADEPQFLKDHIFVPKRVVYSEQLCTLSTPGAR